MSTPDERWQQLLTTARQAPAQRAVLHDFHAATLAAHGLHVYRQQQEAERTWRGLALAASLFMACMIGLGALASLMSDESPLLMGDTFAQVTSQVPNTNFIPAPPRPPPIAMTVAEHMSSLSPTSFINSFNEWINPNTSTQEITP